MKVLGLIPARGGSKGVPRKNVRMLAGRPMIEWTIDVALRAAGVASVVVSTDDHEIAAAARSAGASVPFIRPPELAGDEATSLAVVEHALSVLPEAFDAVLLLQPTSPCRDISDITAVLSMAADSRADSVVSLREADQHPLTMLTMCEDGTMTRLIPGEKAGRRQDMPKIYLPNGAIYFVRVDWLRANREFVGPDTLGYVMSAERSVDIDTPLDWAIAEMLLTREIDRG